MSRGSQYVILGSLWTQVTLLFLGMAVVPELTAGTPASPLVLGLFLAALVAFFSGLRPTWGLRQLALCLHLSVALGWVCWAVDLSNLTLTFEAWILLTLCALIGAVLTDLGLDFDRAAADQGVLSMKDLDLVKPRLSAPLTPELESGAFRF